MENKNSTNSADDNNDQLTQTSATLYDERNDDFAMYLVESEEQTGTETDSSTLAILFFNDNDEEQNVEEMIVNLEFLFVNTEHEDNVEVSNDIPNSQSNASSDEKPDEEMSELLRKLRNKYTGDAIQKECFPTNPHRSENKQYVQFDDMNFHGRIGLVDWCRCSQCVPMATNIESICCLEIENAEPYVQGLKCICQHEFFTFFCTRDETVTINFRSIGEYRQPPPKKDENRLKRKTAYRSFTAWIHGYLGIGNRRPIPSCVVNKVRQAFPDPEGQYMGFISVNDSPAEFMAFE